MDYYVVEYESIDCGDTIEREIQYIDTDKDKAIEYANQMVLAIGRYDIIPVDSGRYTYIAKRGDGIIGSFITVEKFTF